MKLIDHLPPRLAEIKEIADIQEAIEPELLQISRRAEQTVLNRSPLYADLDGIERWEEWLKIKPLPGETLEQRRMDILAKLNERLPFTLPQLYRILCGILGAGRFGITTYPGRAKLDININVSERDAGASIGYLLKRIVPAHIAYEVIMLYRSECLDVGVVSAYEETLIVETLIPQEITNLYLSAPYMATEIIEVENA